MRALAAQVTLALTYVSPEERARLKAAEFTNVGNLRPLAPPFNLRVRVELRRELERDGEKVVQYLLADSSARVYFEAAAPLPTAYRTILEEAAEGQLGLIVRGAHIKMIERHLHVELGPDGTIERPKETYQFGFLAPLASEIVFETEEEEETGE